MKHFLSLRPAYVLAAALAGTGAVLAADNGVVVYDNTQNPDDSFFHRTTREHGDEIYLTSVERTVTQFTFEYFGDFNPATSPNAAAVIRFYRNDGSDAFPGAITALRPLTQLWESSPVALIQSVGGERRSVTLSVPNVLVPDSFTWTVQFTGLAGTAGNSAGLTISYPVSVGATLPLSNGGTIVGSYADFWEEANPLNADSWALFNFEPNARANFYAKVVAIPEPSTLALATAGGVVLLLAAGRFRR